MSNITAPRGHKQSTTAASWGADGATNGQITASNTVPITVGGVPSAASGVYVGTGGTVVAGDRFGNVGVFLNVANGSTLPAGILFVFATAPANGTVYTYPDGVTKITWGNSDGSTATTAANMIPWW